MKNGMWFHGLTAVIGLLVCTPPAVGWEDAGETGASAVHAVTVSLDDLLKVAVARNPEIRRVREAWKATVETHRVSTALPDPQLNFTYFPDPIETRLGPQDFNATVSQMVPYPGKLTLAGKSVEVDARIARLKLDQTVRRVAQKLRSSFHELEYVRRAHRVAMENMRLLGEIRAIAEAGYTDDRTVFNDVVKAQAQEGQLRYDLMLLEELEHTEIARLNGLLDRAPEEPVPPLQPILPQPLAYSLNELYRLGESGREAVRIAEAAVERARIQVDLARLQGRPDFKLGVFYAGIGKPDVAVLPEDAGRDAVGIQAGISIPLWLGKNNGRVERAMAQMRQAEAGQDLEVNETRTRIRSAWFRLENALRLATLYREELLPQALRSLESTETWHRQGAAGLSDAVEAQVTVYNFQLALARARADFGKQLAALETLAGRPLTIRAPLPIREEDAK